MPDYNNSKIYAIRSYQTDKIYIGSTTQKLCKRFANHKSDYKKYLDGRSYYVSSYDIIELGDSYIELLELYPCNGPEELCRREGQLIREHDCVNKNIAGQTKAEYYQTNKDKISEQKKEYYQINKEKRLEYYHANKDAINAKRYIKFDCECGGKYDKSSKARHLKTKLHKDYIESK